MTSAILGNRCPHCLLESALIGPSEKERCESERGSDPSLTPSVVPPWPRFADYELIEELGRGGMGVVYKARQLSLHRIVAVKMLLSGAFAGAEFTRRFRAEAEAAANLHHANIVAIHDFGECAGQPYFSMDYIPGRSLAARIREKPVLPKVAGRYVLAIVRAIGYAHEQGVLHRDLKPSNIIIDTDDQPRITDFGLAKRMTLEEDMTLSGQAIGSPNYMPPEQAAGQREAVGPGSDLFSIGAILYHLLTGRPPFLADSVTATLRQVQEFEPIKPRLINPTVPRDLETICLKCLEKEPKRRFHSATALAGELERFLHGEPIHTRPLGVAERAWRWCRRNPKLASVSGALAVLALVLVIGTPWALLRINREREAALRSAREEARQRQLADSSLYRLENQRVLDLFANDRAPDAIALLASMVRQRSNDTAAAEWLMSELTYRSFVVPVVEPLPHPDMVFYSEFSQDGRYLLTTCRNNSARVWDGVTGRPITTPLQHATNLVQPNEFLGPTRPLVARFSRDGTRVITGSIDRTARVWDAATGLPITPPIPHRAGVSAVQFTPDGRRVATGSSDGAIQFWDATSGLATPPACRHAAEVNWIEFSPDGASIVTASQDSTAQVWDSRTGQPLGPPLRHTKQVRTACFSPDGTKVATASGDYTACLWWTASGTPAAPLLRHAGVVNSARFSPDGTWLVTTSFDKTARVWDVQTGQPVGAPLQHRATVRMAEFSPDGLRVLTCSEDGTARVWDARMGRPLTEPIIHSDRVWWAAFAPDGARAATACQNGLAQIWDVRARRALGTQYTTGTQIKHVEWNKNGRKLLCLLNGTAARSLDVADGRLPATRVLAHQRNLRSACYDSSARYVLTASDDQTAGIWDERTGQLLVPPLRHDGIVYDAAFSPDGNWVITASADQTAVIWETRTGQPGFPPLQHGAAVFVARFSPDGSHVVTTGADRCARLWDLRSGPQASLTLTHPGEVTLARFSPDGQQLLTVATDNAARLWDLHSGRLAVPPLIHRGLINSARFSGDGRRLATASRDSTARVWDAQTGEVLVELVHEGPVNVAAFSQDGQRLLTGSEDGTARLWDTRTGLPASGAFKHPKGVNDAELSPDGRWLAVGCVDWSLYLWERVLAPAPVPAWLPEFAEAVGRRKALHPTSFNEPSRALLRFRERLGHPGEAGTAGNWARWLLEETANRSTLPSASISVDRVVDEAIDEAFGDFFRQRSENLARLEEVLSMAPDNGLIYAQLARLTAKYCPTNDPCRLPRVDWLSRRAIALRPLHPVAWWARAVYFEGVGDPSQALEAMRRGAELGSDNAYFWEGKARLSEQAGRLDLAQEAFTKAIEIVEPMIGWAQSSKDNLVLERAKFLERHGRLEEARRDRLRVKGIFPRDWQTPPMLIDLWTAYNAGLAETPSSGSGQLDLGPVPRGRHVLAGVEFDLRGLVQLAGRYSADRFPAFPQRVEAIPVHQRCRRLHFLHAADWTETEGMEIGRYILYRGDGSREELPIVYGRDVLAWNLEKFALKRSLVIAWEGRNGQQSEVRLFKTTWENPQPQVPIETITFVSSSAQAAPFLVAITADP